MLSATESLKDQEGRTPNSSSLPFMNAKKCMKYMHKINKGGTLFNRLRLLFFELF